MSLSLPGKGLEILKQNELSIQNYDQLTAPKQCNEASAQQRSSEIYTDLRSETCSQITGEKKKGSLGQKTNTMQITMTSKALSSLTC